MSDTDNPLDFDDIANLLVAEGVVATSPSELHGLVCGCLCAGARPDAAAWLQLFADWLDIPALTQEASKVGMLELCSSTLAQLEATDLGFEALLPDDDQMLMQRVTALGGWCQGFLGGFGQHGKQTDASLSDEAREVLGDLGQIAQISAEDDESDDNESDLMEIQEYVRMAALMLFADCNRAPDDDGAAEQPPEVLH
ncbi:UPF0149 protein [Marinobacterium nitratireducens]|uniref:UPF0149 protein n=1 Tax=Marinobacterium nitratireducens TaxID=518897 RepID=A0A917ZQX1_9GAMM|nr:UPF0149 family protein [Marinobacterium nitratireducens]GGO87741.1 UPF0149 protein [Marinobacterium nitratireducens]